MITKDMIKEITRLTKNNIKKKLDRFDQEHLQRTLKKNVYLKTTNETEITAFFGLCYFGGLLEQNDWS